MRTNKPILLLGSSLCLLALAATSHAAGSYKCVDASGNIMLTDVPCHTVQSPPAPATPPRLTETLKPPQPDPVLPPPQQALPSPSAPLPAAPPSSPITAPPAPTAPISPSTQPLQR